MSTGNVAIAERFFEDDSQASVEAYLSFLDPDAEVDFSELDRPYGHVYRGSRRSKTSSKR